MGESSGEIAQQEVASLEAFLDDKRHTQERLREEVAKEAILISQLEVELADLRHEDGPG